MDSDKPIIIGYAGSLSYYDPENSFYENSFLKDWFWTYNHLSNNPSSRSAYFLFQAMRVLKKQFNLNKTNIQISLWGNIDEGNILLAKKFEISDMITFGKYLEKKESRERLNSCDILFLPMESETNLSKPLFIPGKLFEYLKTGKPILALAGDSDCSEILKKSGLGMIFKPQDSRGIAEHLAAVVQNREILKKYIADYDYISQYSFDKITKQLTDTFDELLKEK